MLAVERSSLAPRRLAKPAAVLPRLSCSWLVATCCALAFGLRLYKLADANPWWDEGFTYWLASQNVPGMLLRTAGDTHPPLSYLLYQVWLPLAGRSLFALRFQAALFGVLAIPLVAAAARPLGGPRAAGLAAVLLATSPFHIWWSQQIRMYALVALLCACSLALHIRLLAAWRASSWLDRRLLAAGAAVNLAGLYTLYFFAVLVGLEGLLMLAQAVSLRRARARGKLLVLGWGAAHLVALLLLGPWLMYFKQHAIRFAGQAEPPLSWAEFARATWAELTLGIDTNVQAFGPALVALACMALALLGVLLLRSDAGIPGRAPWSHATRPAPRPRLMAAWLALVAAGLPVAAYAVTLQRGLFFSPTYQTRYDLPALPALIVLLAWGLARLPGWLAVAPLAALLACPAYSLPRQFDARHRTDDYQTLARVVEAYEQPGDAIVFDPDWNFHLFLLDYRGNLPWVAIPLGERLDAPSTAALFTTWTDRYRALWLLQESGGHDAGREHPVHDWLSQHLQPGLQVTVGDRLLTLYQARGAPARSLNQAFRPMISMAGPDGLRGFDRPLTDVRPADVLNVAVYGGSVAGLSVGSERVAGRELPGQTLFRVPILASLRPGRQPIVAHLTGGRDVTLGAVTVESRAALPSRPLPPLARPVGREFGGLALLTSYDLQPPLPRAGQELEVRLQWRALRPFDQNYTVFVHLLDAADHVVAQRDSQPDQGRRPTVGWQPGEELNDAYALNLPAGLAPGQYRLELGLYLQSTGRRLPLSDAPGEDRLLLDPVTVN